MYIDGVQTPAMLLASLPLPIPVSDYLRLIPIMLWWENLRWMSPGTNQLHFCNVCNQGI